VDAEGELIIYPAVDPVRLPPEEAGRHAGGSFSAGRGKSDEIFGLRPMREGDDPRDIYWRKSTIENQHVLRERARETRPDVELTLDVVRPTGSTDAFANLFERRVRELASRAVAHMKRGDGVAVRTTLGERVRSDRTLGADPILRFLALIEPVDEGQADEQRARIRERARRGPEPSLLAGARAGA
jgi:uncharacterized protein (DUF58 family)